MALERIIENKKEAVDAFLKTDACCFLLGKHLSKMFPKSFSDVFKQEIEEKFSNNIYMLTLDDERMIEFRLLGIRFPDLENISLTHGIKYYINSNCITSDLARKLQINHNNLYLDEEFIVVYKALLNGIFVRFQTKKFYNKFKIVVAKHNKKLLKNV